MGKPSLSSAQVKRWFVGALLVAAAVRGYLLWQYYCISSDGVRYLRAAENFYTGEFMAGLSSLYPPGYPVLIAAIYPLFGDWELAGQSLSLLFGVTLLFPLYWLFRQVFDSRIALLGCYLAGLSPFLALYSVHVRSESPYLFLSTLAVALFATALTGKSLGRFLLGGVVAGYAYLVRPEAIGFLAIVAAVMFIQWWRRENRLFWSLQSVGAMMLGFLLFALPFIVYLSFETGTFGAISRKAGLTLAINLKQSGMLEDDDGGAQSTNVHSVSFTEYVLQHPVLYLKKVLLDVPAAFGVFFEALHFSFVPFFLVGVYLAIRQNDWRGPSLLLAATVLFFVVGFSLIYVKRRYSLQAVPMSLGWVAVGIGYCWDKLHVTFSARQARWAAVCVGVIFLTATLPKTLRPVSREKAYVRDTGWYLKALNKTGNLKVAALDARIAFYAEARDMQLREVEQEDLADRLRAEKATHLAVEAKAFQRVYPAVAAAPERYGLALEKMFVGTRNERMLLFRIII